MLVKSRVRWVDEGEKASRYFCNLENRNFVSKRMSSLINNDGTELFKNDEIKDEVFNFYRTLYSSKEHDINDIDLEVVLDKNTPKLNELESLSMEGKITLDEAGRFLQKMQNNKSPGSTGFTSEFYKFFWKDLVFLLL